MKRAELAPDARRRRYSKWTHLILGAAIGLGLGTTPVGAGLPTSATDQTKVPHYFGPFPNWVLSPLTLPDATVSLTAPPSGGKQATAAATVGANGTVTGITITDPGAGYINPPAISFSGSGSGAVATAAVTASGAVTAVNVGGTPVSTAGWGSNYSAPVAAITGGNGTGAYATVYGGVHAVAMVGAGAGYTFPTVDFDMPDGADGVQAQAYALCDGQVNCPVGGNGAITGIVVTQPGSGYSYAPNVVIRNGTAYDPINMVNGGPSASATATLAVQTVVVDAGGSGYTSAPTVTISDPGGLGSGATATASTDFGTVSAIQLEQGGSGYITAGGMKKFQDGLPGLCNPSVAGSCDGAKNNLGQYIPLAIPDTGTFTTGNGFSADSDYYQIALVQHRECMSSSLPGCGPADNPKKGTLLRAYVQLETPANASWSKHIPLRTDLVKPLPNGDTSVPVLMPDGSQAYGVDNPHFLGPVIAATKDKAVRITFYNLLPTGTGGDLYIPTDSTLMGAGFGPLDNWPAPNPPVVGAGDVLDGIRNPECTQDTKGTDTNCFRDNRATLHLHGGTSPWISDGTPHQWITPAGEGAVTNPTRTDWPEGESVGNVPDMTGTAIQALGVPDCSQPADGCQTFYYTNQQGARLMFYHDHASGTTRLNVYLGEAAGYLISDSTEANLVATNTIPSEQIPLVIQDRTFVPSPAQIDKQDPTWDADRWGGQGNFWYHHVYMPAQNPGDPSGMSAYGRWMYGPWFWPPASPPNGPIPNPYYQMDPNASPAFSQPLPPNKLCNLNDPATWQYNTDPFCEPQFIPGTPNISAGMEQFNDTPMVNGTAYPTLTVDPKTYRLRVLNAANDRFWNLSLYVADPTTGTDSEVALNASELAAAQTDPNIVPTPDTSLSPPGPNWIVIGSEGGFLPAPVVVPPQPTTWITDPTRFDVGNVDQHSLLLGPAERADVIVDFSQYKGKTLIVYNDAPAAFPARVATYDYYTGTPDLSPNGAPAVLPGYGPNTRTVMQIKVRGDVNAADTFNLNRLKTAFAHKANGTGVFESGQHPIIVGQYAYNSAYGTNFVANGACNLPGATGRCDGFARISDQGPQSFGFNTLKAPYDKLVFDMQPKAMHDEMNSAAFDEFGRMTANLGLEAVPAGPNGQTITLLPYINPTTEIFDGTNLPSADTKVTPIASATDGSQIWKITHNGVDTHPIHFHLYDVQVLNRVTWDNIIIPPDPTELGWKDTVRISPLEDTIVAIRPVVPKVPFELPNSIRALNPATGFVLPESQMGFNPIAIDPATGQPVAATVTNQLVNFGWEYVWHCHILSHEEMDMMRPQSLVLPPNKPDTLTNSWVGANVRLTWMDQSISETSFQVQKSADGTNWIDVGAPVQSPLDAANVHQQRFLDDPDAFDGVHDKYRVVANNSVGYGGAFPSVTARSYSSTLTVVPPPPADPTSAVAAQSGAQIVLTFADNSTDETGFVVQRSTDGVNFSDYATLAANALSFTDTGVLAVGVTYTYRVAAVRGTTAQSGWATSNGVTVAPPPAPSAVAATQVQGTIVVTFTNNASDQTGFVVQRKVGAGAFADIGTVPANATTFTDPGPLTVGTIYQYQVATVRSTQYSAYVASNNVTVVGSVAAPTLARAVLTNATTITVSFTDNSANETGFLVQRSEGGGPWVSLTLPPPFGPFAGTGTPGRTYVDATVPPNGSYRYQVAAVNQAYQSGFAVTGPVVTVPASPTNVAATKVRVGTTTTATTTLTWTDMSGYETGFRVQRSANLQWTGITQFLVGPNVTSYAFSGNRNTKYYYRVRAENAAGASVYAPPAPYLCVPADNAATVPAGACP